MRYTIGKKYIFIRLNFDEKNPGLYRLYKPWEDTLHGINFFVMECVEHHKVSNGHEEAKTCDGFVFKLVQTNTTYELTGEDDPLPQIGSLWNNQYPTASYGQMDTSNDYKLVPADQHDPKLDSYHYGSGRLDDVHEVMENVYRGISYLTLQNDKMKVQKEALSDWLHKLHMELNEKYGLGMLIGPLKSRSKDGKEQDTGFLHVVLTRPQQGLLAQSSTDKATSDQRFQAELEASYEEETTAMMNHGNGGKGYLQK